MEAFLLTLDVVCIVLLCLRVNRTCKTLNPSDLGVFAYSAREDLQKRMTTKSQGA